jgi:hypothetical protein
VKVQRPGINRIFIADMRNIHRITALVDALGLLDKLSAVLAADDTMERYSGRKINAKGCDRDAVRSSKSQVNRCFGLKRVSMMLLVAVPWRQRRWALPCLTARCWPADKRGQRRYTTCIAWVRQMRTQVRRWLPERRRVLVADGGFAAVSSALACVNSRVAMVSRLRWDAALSHPPEPQSPGKRFRKRAKERCHPSLRAWASRSDISWEDVEVAWYDGQPLWGFSHTALWDHPRLAPGRQPRCARR